MKSEDPSKTTAVSLLGCGWLGVALAPSLMSYGFRVRGSTTRSSKLSQLSSMDVEPLLLRIEPQEPGSTFSATTGSAVFFNSETLVINLPPEAALGADYHPGQIASILSLLMPDRSSSDLKHIVYVSSTSVYGAWQGAVDESTPPKPDEGSGEILLRTESMLTDWARANSVAVSIVRPGGLIGPGRHPGLFLAGRKNALNGESPVNLIHQLDLVEILTAIIVAGRPSSGESEIYNAVSSHHPLRKDFYVRAALAIGVEAPTFAKVDDSASGRYPASAKLVMSLNLKHLKGLILKNDDLYSSMGVKHETH